MSDFLTRLAGRALATVPVAQPLIPARFTPAPEPSGFSEVHDFREERIESARREPIEDTVAADQPPERTPRRDTLPNTRESAVHAAPPGERGETAQSSTRSLEPARTAPKLVNVRVPDSVPHREAVRTSTLDRAREPARTIPESSAVPAAAGISDRSPRAVPQTAPRPPAPIIRVTIGRVDVRAEFPAPAAPAVKRRPEAQSLSLDDYLKLRNEGKR
jgi:hypothetical protein